MLISLFRSSPVLSAEDLMDNGISKDLIQWYRKSEWISSLGKGIYVLSGYEPTLDECVSFLQAKQEKKLFYSGKYVLARFYDVVHFVLPDDTVPALTLSSEQKLPLWFLQKFRNKIKVLQTDFLPADTGYETFKDSKINLVHSSEERAFLELLYGVPKETTVSEALELLELLPNLRPALMQKLLENCTSIKVKRLFLYLAEEVNHGWFNHLDLSRISLGNGIREIEKNGTFVKKYDIVVRKEGI